MKLKLQSGEVKTLINEDVKTQLIEAKDNITAFYNMKVKMGYNYVTSKWDIYRSLLNKYETIPRGKKKMNRAYFKLKELMIDDSDEFKKIKKVAALAEGPGGFIQFITDYYPNAEVYGITLKYETDEAAQNRNMKQFDTNKVKIIYGAEGNPGHDGNLYNSEVVTAFAERVGKVDLVTADGGFEAKDENNKEVEHVKLFLAESLTAFRVLRKGGSFILKIYDVFTKPTLELLFMLSSVFKTVELKKPVSSRPANSERYVVCHGFKGFDVEEHVREEDEPYSSILELNKTETTRFEKFLYNLDKQNEEYVKQIIKNINDVVDYIRINENNNVEKNNKKKEQELYKEVWEKVYEKKERKRLRELKKQGLNTDVKEFVM